MKRIVDWFWEYGVKRPMEWTITPSGLNTIMGVVSREATINNAVSSHVRKACVAFWGPSQSGKSSLLSHYLDGDSDGDLALMWNPNQKVLFSTRPNQGTVDPDAVVFNPFNGSMDASGVVTRFYLPTADEAARINIEAPVEIILADRKQVMNAIAVGYRMECQESQNPWGLDELRKRISAPSVNPNREAFEYLFDVCDVCENMARETSRYREFLNGPKLRQQILGSSYADDLSRAKELAAYVLWDSEKELSDLFESIMKVREVIVQNHDKQCPGCIYASMEVAALLEDINILAQYERSRNSDTTPEVRHRMQTLDSLVLSATPRGMFLTCNGHTPPDKRTSGNLNIKIFGKFQALIGEMRIPVRKPSGDTGKPFFDFLESCDLLDIPGVTNKASGEAQGVENLIDLSKNPSESQLLSRVYKSGKTLSIVYNQAAHCSIDSFVIFVDLDRAGGISRPATIDSGLKAWLSPYDITSFDARPPLKLYLNCSLFGKLMDKVVAAVHGAGLSTYCKNAEALDFVKAHCFDCFITTNCFAPCNDAMNVKHYFEEDPEFKRVFLGPKGQASLDAVFSDSLGTDYMFKSLLNDITPDVRLSHYGKIRGKNRDVLRAELIRILPTGQEGAAALRREVAQKVYDRVLQQVHSDKPEQIRKLATFVKSVFSVDASDFEPIPKTPHRVHDSELTDYILRQLHKWVTSRKEELSGNDIYSWLISEDESYPFLEAVSTIDIDAVVNILKTDYWNHSPKVSRTFLAMTLTNCFLWGDVARPCCEKRTDAYGMLCAPFISRMNQLATTTRTQAGVRPSDIPGDPQLLEIARELNLI